DLARPDPSRPPGVARLSGLLLLGREGQELDDGGGVCAGRHHPRRQAALRGRQSLTLNAADVGVDAYLSVSITSSSASLPGRTRSSGNVESGSSTRPSWVTKSSLSGSM